MRMHVGNEERFVCSNLWVRHSTHSTPEHATGIAKGPFDYLLADAIRAAVLWDGGILVNVPQPERYAVHKLIVAEPRTESAIAKRQKDLHQASSLFDALAEHRAHDLAAAWKESYERGPQWRKHLLAALSHLHQLGRDRLLYAIGQSGKSASYGRRKTQVKATASGKTRECLDRPLATSVPPWCGARWSACLIVTRYGCTRTSKAPAPCVGESWART